jgi:hypothetical protein
VPGSAATGRFTTPGEVATLTTFLASGRAATITGANPSAGERLTECPRWPVKDQFGRILGCRAVPARRCAVGHRNTERDVQAGPAGAGELPPALGTWLTGGQTARAGAWPRRPGTPFADGCRPPSAPGRLPSCRRAARLGCAYGHKHTPAAAAALPPGQAGPTGASHHWLDDPSGTHNVPFGRGSDVLADYEAPAQIGG